MRPLDCQLNLQPDSACPVVLGSSSTGSASSSAHRQLNVSSSSCRRKATPDACSRPATQLARSSVIAMSSSSSSPSSPRHHSLFLLTIPYSCLLLLLLANCIPPSRAGGSTLSAVHSIIHPPPPSPAQLPSSNGTSTMYFESAHANFSLQPPVASSTPMTSLQTSASWKANHFLAPPTITTISSPISRQPQPALQFPLFMQESAEHKTQTTPSKGQQYANSTTTLLQAAQQLSLPTASLPFGSDLLSNSLVQEGGEHGYEGLVQPADQFSNPFYMSSHIVDPLLDQGGADPYQGAHPILMDFMHMKTPEDASLLYQTPHSPGSQSFFGFDGLTPDHDHYPTLTDTDQEIYHKSPGYASLSHSAPGDYESKRPVAQNMLFISKNTKYQSYYTPFKVNTINVYAKYLTHGGGYGSKCSKKDKDMLSLKDIHAAINDASKTVNWYQNTVTNNAVATRRKTPYIPAGVLDSKMFEYASAALKKRKCFNKMDVITILPKIDVSNMVSRYSMPACQQPQKIKCDPKAKYRSIDGSCNNLKMKSWGRSFTCHRRLLPPDYADGVSAPRIAYSGGKLPNARELSSILFPDINVMDHKLTSMVMAFGQFAIHDITRTLPTSNDIRCCPSKTAKHPECFAIDITRYDDVLVKAYNQTCINFVRSITCNPCSLGPREQQNQATHTFDMSHQYGLRLNDSLALRTRRGGKLRSSSTSTYPKEELPPKMTREDPSCNVRPKPPRFKCFESADGVRASQHPALQALHTAFHRRHNQHADRLAKINPHWDDEKLYQEARRITIAEQSKMIYGEYLPAIFGKKLVKHFRLGINYKGYTKYDSKLNPATIQEFIVASGRFGHSQINDQFRVLFKDKKMSYSYNLRDNFFETTIVSLGHSGGVLKGVSIDSTEATDPYFVDDIKNSLYHLRKEKIGRDLPAFNIQRGRDHGIPGYVFYLDFCFGFKVKGWNDLVTFIPKKQLKKIQAFYKHWKDVDLFVGGISERLIAGAAFGPTFACINGIQFYNFKYGDRFYFEHGYQAGSFTPAQLDNIKKVSSLSQLICKTHPEVGYMPQSAFIRSHDYKPCSSFPELDYSLWVDRKGRGPVYRPKYKGTGHYRAGSYKANYGVKPSKSHARKGYKHHSESYSIDNPVNTQYVKDSHYEEDGPTDDMDDTDDTAPRSKVFAGEEAAQRPPAPILPALLLNDAVPAAAAAPVAPVPPLLSTRPVQSSVHQFPPPPPPPPLQLPRPPLKTTPPKASHKLPGKQPIKPLVIHH